MRPGEILDAGGAGAHASGCAPRNVASHLFDFLGWWLRDARRRYRLARRTIPGLQTAEGVRIVSPERLSADGDVYIDHGAYLHCGGTSWCRDRGGIRIGRGSYVGPQCVLFGMGEIEIGELVMIAPNAVVSSVQHPYRDTSRPMYAQERILEKVSIGNDVYIGSNAVVTPGVRIGRGAVVGAGAVVTRDVAEETIVLGVPARPVGRRGSDEPWTS